MSIPAHITAAIRSGNFTYCGEAQLSNFGETARKGRYVEFLLDDGPDGSARHPFHGLSCGREKGQRFALIAVPLGDDDAVEAPEPRTERKPAATLAEKMRRICGVPAFQFWLAVKNGCDEYGFSQLTKNEMYAQTLEWVKAACKISSTKEFDSDPDAEFHGKTLLAEYEQATGRMAERH